MPDNLTGSCLRGAITYRTTAPPKAVANCHCKTCRKITGGPFETIAIFAKDALDITAGQDLLKTYQISERATKHFCGNCGTPLYNLHKKYPGNYMVHAGSLDDPTRVTPVINIFCESMLPWVRDITALKCFEREPTR